MKTTIIFLLAICCVTFLSAQETHLHSKQELHSDYSTFLHGDTLEVSDFEKRIGRYTDGIVYCNDEGKRIFSITEKHSKKRKLNNTVTIHYYALNKRVVIDCKGKCEGERHYHKEWLGKDGQVAFSVFRFRKGAKGEENYVHMIFRVPTKSGEYEDVQCSLKLTS